VIATEERAISGVFLLSGFAALLYQVVWQRSLFAIYGINVEAVTVVVTAFMVGLGFGSLAGGALSKSPRVPALALFGVVELAIGAFGLGSLPLYRWVGARTLQLQFAATAAVTFLVVLVPTLLMGSTLPLLTAHLVRRSRNVGRSLGRLYSVNTLGSALASLAAVLLLMRALGQQGVVAVAAALNLIVGVSALALFAATRDRAR
jgi:predicted membrane-bound spermidine synthase